MKKKFHQRSWISFVSQTEEVMYCRQEKSYGAELVTQIFMILGYLNSMICLAQNLVKFYNNTSLQAATAKLP